jgi:hypothetical protein
MTCSSYNDNIMHKKCVVEFRGSGCILRWPDIRGYKLPLNVTGCVSGVVAFSGSTHSHSDKLSPTHYAYSGVIHNYFSHQAKLLPDSMTSAITQSF